MSRYGIKVYFIWPAAITAVVLLPIFSQLWAADVPGSSQSGETITVAASVDHSPTAADDDIWEEENSWDDEWGEEAIADPLEPLNRLFFRFNDKLYYWVLKPVAKVYGAIVPEGLQIAFRNFFENLRTPTRAVNSLFQGQAKDSSVEVARFFINSTVGILGFSDAAKDIWNLESTREDTGQTFGYYGAGGGFYINWPFLGPSNLRDTVGLVGDLYLHPYTYLDMDWEVNVGVEVFEKVNSTALTMGDYELFTETALDPYTAVKDAYQQYRNGLIRE